MTNLTCIIIDDEKRNTTFLKNLLNQHCPNVIILATETNPKNGLLLINELAPQLVFLDIEMPVLNGFELLKKVEKNNFEVVFVTAYSHYAIEAFEYNAIGYLTKPINTEKLIAAVATAAARGDKKLTGNQKQLNNQAFAAEESLMATLSTQKIPLTTSNGLLFVKMCEICFCESSGNYTFFHLSGDKKIIVTRQLGEYEKLLPDAFFIRIHDKYIINITVIKAYLKGTGGGLIKMDDGKELPVATRRKEEFLSKFEKWTKRKQ